jgi:hypothetical protein
MTYFVRGVAAGEVFLLNMRGLMTRSSNGEQLQVYNHQPMRRSTQAELQELARLFEEAAGPGLKLSSAGMPELGADGQFQHRLFVTSVR